MNEESNKATDGLLVPAAEGIATLRALCPRLVAHSAYLTGSASGGATLRALKFIDDVASDPDNGSHYAVHSRAATVLAALADDLGGMWASGKGKESNIANRVNLIREMRSVMDLAVAAADLAISEGIADVQNDGVALAEGPFE